MHDIFVKLVDEVLAIVGVQHSAHWHRVIDDKCSKQFLFGLHFFDDALIVLLGQERLNVIIVW